MVFSYDLEVRLTDTDAAGVVYFANLLDLCHQAYEASLRSAGIDLRNFFTAPRVPIPIVHGEIDFLKPLYCGDRLSIEVIPEQINDSEFRINYRVLIRENSQLVAIANTRHVAIDAVTRKRTKLPVDIHTWIGSNS
jgi:1,4-dihydroxy-2-naphthoyl-CoA hydrolase